MSHNPTTNRPLPPDRAAGLPGTFSLVPAGITTRTHRQVTALFGRLSLVPPGVVPVVEWRPAAGCHQPQAADMYAGLVITGRQGHRR